MLSIHTIHERLPITPYSGSLARHSDLERTEAIQSSVQILDKKLISRTDAETARAAEIDYPVILPIWTQWPALCA